jgi:hypothetical protein
MVTRHAGDVPTGAPVEHVGDLEQLAGIWRWRGRDALLAELVFERADAQMLRHEMRLEIPEHVAAGHSRSVAIAGRLRGCSRPA